MPRKQMRKGRKGGRRMRRALRRVPRAVVTNNDYARAHQTIQLGDDTIGTIYNLDDVNLSQFDRLKTIGQTYQFFRVNMIEMKFKPYQDTFFTGNQPGTPGTIPYLHYLVDKGENLLPTTFNQLRDAGAKPIRFDDKTITVRWKPRVNTNVAGDSTATPSQAYMASKVSPWLPTNWAAGADPLAWNASQVPHKGMFYGVWSSVVPAVQSYGTEITVYMEFRKAIVFGDASQTPPTKKSLAAKDEIVV